MEVIEPQPTQDAPYLVEDYPYGFRLRTQVRYWVETSKRYGQRLVFQSLNPKNGKWNAPKPSGYSNIILAGLDEKGHVTTHGARVYSLEETLKFKELYEQYLSEYQKIELTNILKMLEVLSHVEYKIRATKWKNLITGEITERLPVLEMQDYIEVNDLGDPVDSKADKEIDRQDNITLNRAMIANAAKETDIQSALDTFKRVK